MTIYDSVSKRTHYLHLFNSIRVRPFKENIEFFQQQEHERCHRIIQRQAETMGIYKTFKDGSCEWGENF